MLFLTLLVLHWGYQTFVFSKSCFFFQRLTQIEGRSSEDRGAAKRLSEAYQEREAELNSMKNELEDAEEKKRAAQSTLDAAYKLLLIRFLTNICLLFYFLFQL